MNHFEKLLELAKNARRESLEMSLDDCHADGLFSLVIDGTAPGELTRVFIAEEQIKPYQIQMHSHKYDLEITALTLGIRHHYFQGKSDMAVKMPCFTYDSLDKSFERDHDSFGYTETIDLPPLSVIRLNSFDIHTVSCEESSAWVVQEIDLQESKSMFLGEPFTVEGLYNRPGFDKIEYMQGVLVHRLEEICKNLKPESVLA